MMNLIITGHQFEFEPKDKGMITHKAETKLEKYNSILHNVAIVVTKEHFMIKTECTITSDFGKFFAHASEEKLETSIDNTLAKVIAEIVKKHDKIVYNGK